MSDYHLLTKDTGEKLFSHGSCKISLLLIHAHPQPTLITYKFTISPTAHQKRCANSTTHLYIHRQMRPRHDLFARLAPAARRPVCRWPALHGLHVRLHAEIRELLQEPDEEERDFLVRKLLPEADPGAGVEGAEDEWVRGEVLVQALVEEAVGIEFESWVRSISLWIVRLSDNGYHRDPRGQFAGA